VNVRVLRHIIGILLVRLFVIALGLFIIQPAYAVTVPVTNTLDNGPGSLRQAVTTAAPGDTIVFDTSVFSVPLTITLRSGQIEISKSLRIDGSVGGTTTPTLSGGNLSRVLQVEAMADVALTSLRIVNGKCTDCNGGGLLNSGILTIDDVTFADNSVPTTGAYGVGFGGALFNSGTLTVTRSTFAGGAASHGGGLVNTFNSTLTLLGSTFISNTALMAGAVYNDGTLSVIGSLFAGNSAPNGTAGAIEHHYGVLSIQGSTIAGNRALVGAGLDTSQGIISVSDTAFVNNSASWVGGGIYSHGALSVTNSTIVSNSATGGSGGGVYNTGELSILNSTLTKNSSTNSGGGIYNTKAITLANTIVGNNPTGGNCGTTAGKAITDSGHNLDSDHSCGFSASVNSLNDTDPLLGNPGYYDGPVLTIPLLSGSPAIDAGDNAACPVMDARGMARPFGSRCDIGAYEALSSYIVTTTLDAGPGSLRQTVLDVVNLA
jgi:predicted outer membrane repeat protein